MEASDPLIAILFDGNKFRGVKGPNSYILKLRIWNFRPGDIPNLLCLDHTGNIGPKAGSDRFELVVDLSFYFSTKYGKVLYIIDSSRVRLQVRNPLPLLITYIVLIGYSRHKKNKKNIETKSRHF